MSTRALLFYINNILSVIYYKHLCQTTKWVAIYLRVGTLEDVYYGNTLTSAINKIFAQSLATYT